MVSLEEEAAYLTVAEPMLQDFAILEFDCGLRPEEAYALRWSQIRNNAVVILTGKTASARRTIPASPRVLEMLRRRRVEVPGEFVFPAATKSGHADVSTLRKLHRNAVAASGVEAFVVYSMRHTCVTRWAEGGLDPFTLKKLAGHSNSTTTLGYVHMGDSASRKALEVVWVGTKVVTIPKLRVDLKKLQVV